MARAGDRSMDADADRIAKATSCKKSISQIEVMSSPMCLVVHIGTPFVRWHAGSKWFILEPKEIVGGDDGRDMANSNKNQIDDLDLDWSDVLPSDEGEGDLEVEPANDGVRAVVVTRRTSWLERRWIYLVGGSLYMVAYAVSEDEALRLCVEWCASHGESYLADDDVRRFYSAAVEGGQSKTISMIAALDGTLAVDRHYIHGDDWKLITDGSKVELNSIFGEELLTEIDRFSVCGVI